MQALSMSTLSKLTHHDLLKFEAILASIFPALPPLATPFQSLEEAIRQVLQGGGFKVIENQVQKIVQFEQALKQRIGVVLVGQSGCGKTLLWNTLKKVRELRGQEMKIFVMNPKSMLRSQLLGFMNNEIREFTDGKADLVNPI